MNDGVVVNLDALNREIQMLSGKQLTKLEKSSLRKGIKVIQREARKQLKSVLPAATKSNPKYNDTLVQGVLSSVKEQGDSSMLAKVHIMGTRQKSSGTYRLRFFEVGTTRYKKDGSVYGINRGNKKFHFFDSAYNAAASKSTDTMFNELTKRITEINNG